MKLVPQDSTGQVSEALWQGGGNDPAFVVRKLYPETADSVELKRRRLGLGLSAMRAAARLEIRLDEFEGLESGRLSPEDPGDWYLILSRFL